MRRWIFMAVVLLALYAAVSWPNGARIGFEAPKERSMAPALPPAAARAAAGPGHASKAKQVKTFILPKCPEQRPESDSRCDLAADYAQRCGYLVGDQQVTCTCDAPESSLQRTWVCRDADEEAELAAYPRCPAEQPSIGSECGFPTLACPYPEGKLRCACGEDDHLWSCEPLRRQRL